MCFMSVESLTVIQILGVFIFRIGIFWYRLRNSQIQYKGQNLQHKYGYSRCYFNYKNIEKFLKFIKIFMLEFTSK